MNAAARNLRRHLAELRERMQHPTAYEKALTYFGDHLAANRALLEQSVVVPPDEFEPLLGHIVGGVLGERVRLENPRVLCLTEFGFYHGCVTAPGRLVVFFYVKDLGIGIAALVPGLSKGTHEVVRFRFLLQPASWPERN